MLKICREQRAVQEVYEIPFQPRTKAPGLVVTFGNEKGGGERSSQKLNQCHLKGSTRRADSGLGRQPQALQGDQTILLPTRSLAANAQPKLFISYRDNH